MESNSRLSAQFVVQAETLAENGLIRDRNVNAARAEHLNEIIKTRIDFFEHMDVVQQKYGKYKELKFPAI